MFARVMIRLIPEDPSTRSFGDVLETNKLIASCCVYEQDITDFEDILCRLKIEKDLSCRYCGVEPEDGYHVLIHCNSVPGYDDFKKARSLCRVTSRLGYDKLLFSDDDEVKSIRGELLTLCLRYAICI